jgi:hypothetical protein
VGYRPQEQYLEYNTNEYDWLPYPTVILLSSLILIFIVDEGAIFNNYILNMTLCSDEHYRSTD